jgi:serine/threonine protein kinase
LGAAVTIPSVPFAGLSDRQLNGLRRVLAEPDLRGTRYELRELVGRGGMASVYRAHDRVLERDVALKVLDLPEAAEEKAGSGARLADRMNAEARILARLEHPSIVPVHDAGTLPDGRAFCAMKLVEGQPLDRLFAAPPESSEVRHRVRLLLRVCDAVAFAHARGVVHRDLKPQNVMVGAFGEVVVLDWGLALADAAGAGAERSEGAGEIAGTPAYMAPEQETGRAREADARSDVYGLGALLHFLIRGMPPRRPLEFADTPRPLAAICRAALAVDPGARYSSVAALAADLERFLDGSSVSVYREPWRERAARWFARHQTAVLLVAAYLLVRTVLLLLRRA